MKVDVRIYDKCKYEKDSKVYTNATITNVRSIAVKSVPKRVMLNYTDFDGIDDYDEYLVITYNTGETSTFRNSHVDVFRVGM